MESTDWKKGPTDRLTAITAVVLLIDGLALIGAASFMLIQSEYLLSASFSLSIASFGIAPAGVGLWFRKSRHFWKIEIGFSTFLSLFGLVLCLIDWIYVGTTHLMIFAPLLITPIIVGPIYWFMQRLKDDS